MSATPDLQFRQLMDMDRELLAALIETAAADDPKAVNFGQPVPARLEAGAEVWVLNVRGALCGAAWLKRSPGGWSEVLGLLLARDWWNTGLAVWMLEELVRDVGQAGGKGLRAIIGDAAAPAVGETLADAGFLGPDPEEDDYPAGIWERLA